MVMEITEVVVNYTAWNYFDDYDEIRSERMAWVEPEKVSKAIDKLVRRYRNRRECDCMFVKNENGTGWRLMYDIDPELFESGIEEKGLRLRHYTNMRHSIWDTDETVSVAKAKERILGGEQ
jgi:hypothetical protein